MYLLYNKKKLEIEDCTTFGSRLKGFMLQKKPIEKGKRFPKCNSIHTFFMFQQIDVIMTDKNNRIIKIYPHFKKRRIILPKKNIYYTYELPINTCQHYQLGDYLKIES